MEEIKFCKDCKHYTAPGRVGIWGAAGINYSDACHSPSRPITPEFYLNGHSAAAIPVNARMPDGFCTPQAVYWEDRPAPPEKPVLVEVAPYNTLQPVDVMPTPWWKFWKKGE